MEGFGQAWKRSKGVFLTVAAFAAFLPVLLAGVLNPGQLRLLTKADSPTPLRIWIQPTTVVATVGKPFTLEVMGEYADAQQSIFSITANAVAEGDIQLTNPQISSPEQFSGTKRIGTITGVATKAGKFSVSIPAESVKTGIANLQIVTNTAEVLVK